LKKVLLPVLGLLFVALACGGAAWADVSDPADLHVGTGAGTPCATGCGADPNTITSTAWDVFYNPNGNQSAIGSPFYLIVATPVYTGSNNSPTVGGTATMYAPYSAFPGGSSSVTVDNLINWGTMTNSKPNDIYTFIGLGSSVTNSFNFGNMVSCDTGVGGCPNAGLQGSNAPLFGDTITGFDITTWTIETNTFAPHDLLDFTGNLPIGSYVAAIGCIGAVGSQECWAVPFTESGDVTGTPSVPEPGSLTFLGAGLLGLALVAGRRVLTA